LPDFDRYNKPKREKFIPNGHNLYEMASNFTKWL
jgi:hypothetical protein